MLQGKVAIVTGAARGLGRTEALEMGRLGARVVVNDLGTRSDGSGRDEDPARAVVEEIRAFGGEATPHFGDVANWSDSQAMLQTALREFGQLDILVNNAGFLRDRMLFNMSEEDFDSVVRVHLKGHFCATRLAAAYWREQAKTKGEPVYGRIINTSSEAFLFGSPGQPNYAAAKAGIVALTMAAAQSMIRYGVNANAIMPRARTRMTDTGPTAPMFAKPEEGFDTFAPENVSPLVAYLASPQAARISAFVFLVWGKMITIVDRPSLGQAFESEQPWTPRNVAEKLSPHFEKLEPIKDGFVFPVG